jgi:hypothetical protein
MVWRLGSQFALVHDPTSNWIVRSGRTSELYQTGLVTQ